MAERKHRRKDARDPLAGESERAQASPVENARGPEQVVLPLQRSAGNQAVGAMLSRWGPTFGVPTQKAEERGADAHPPKHTVHVKIAGVGEFEALSIHLGPRKRDRDDGRDTEKKPDAKKKEILESVTLTKLSDKLSSKLLQLAAEGRPLSVEIHYGPITILIPDAQIGNYSVSSGGDVPTESMEFNGTVEVDTHEPTEEGTGSP